jgi:hypothetical protein
MLSVCGSVGPARKHGIPDADIWHGVRNATHKIDIGDDIEVEDLADLRAIAEAAERARRDEVLLTERVALARAHGRSWNRIAAALGVSRQAARQRFGGKVGA